MRNDFRIYLLQLKNHRAKVVTISKIAKFPRLWVHFRTRSAVNEGVRFLLHGLSKALADFAKRLFARADNNLDLQRGLNKGLEVLVKYHPLQIEETVRDQN